VVNFIQLRDGCIVREDAVLLALDLERQGYALSISDGKLSVTPGSKLTADERTQIQSCRLHLMELLDYCTHAPEPR
jgi:hypothetical protein